MNGLLALETVEVLSETTAMCFQKMSLYSEHKQSVEFIERVKNAEEVTGMSMSGNGEKISQGRREKRGELLFGENFKERGLVVIECALKGSHKLHSFAFVEIPLPL